MADCEGCEWEAFHHLVYHRPRLLCRVRQLSMELHVRKSATLNNISNLTSLMNHVVEQHGFRIFRGIGNGGWYEKPPALLPELKAWNFPEGECCYNVHMIRPSLEGTVCRSGASLSDVARGGSAQC